MRAGGRGGADNRPAAPVQTPGVGLLSDSEKVAVKGGAFPKPPLVAPEASAIGPHRSRSAAGPGVPSDKGLRPQPLAANGSAPPAPPEVNARHPPPTTPRDVFVKTSGGPLPRGPLSYDALVHLRKSGSTKKTPLCPTVDHTIDGGGELPAAAGGLETRSGGPRPQAKRPPAVAPKPKAALPKPPAKPERDEAAPEDCPRGLTHAMDPEVVRLEALRKLGLLREAEAGGEALGPLPPPKPPSFLNPKPSRGPDRSPPSCSSERQSNQQNHANGERRPAGRPSADPGSAEAPPGACDASGAVGYTVMVLPGMGADRKEALRKLGLLKNDSR